MLRKVTAFVICHGVPRTRLLTLLHPAGGRQLPAGSVEDTETPEHAAVREVFEETGLSLNAPLILLGEMRDDLQDEVVALEDVKMPSGFQLKRGHRAKVLERRADELRLKALLYDFRTDPPTERHTPAAWAPASSFTAALHRSFFYCAIPWTGRMRWNHLADGQLFGVEWLDLRQDLIFSEPQQHWFDHVWPLLHSGGEGFATQRSEHSPSG